MKLNKIQMTLIHRYQNAQLILSDKNDAIQFVTSNCASASFNLGKKKERKKKKIRAHPAWARDTTSHPVELAGRMKGLYSRHIWMTESTCHCATWGNMTTSCGGVNGKKNKQGSQTPAPRFTLCGLRKWATLMSICTYDFYCSKQDPPPLLLPGNHNTPNNARLCEGGLKNKKTKTQNG